jgi:hypothetical protein
MSLNQQSYQYTTETFSLYIENSLMQRYFMCKTILKVSHSKKKSEHSLVAFILKCTNFVKILILTKYEKIKQIGRQLVIKRKLVNNITNNR